MSSVINKILHLNLKFFFYFKVNFEWRPSSDQRPQFIINNEFFCLKQNKTRYSLSGPLLLLDDKKYMKEQKCLWDGYIKFGLNNRRGNGELSRWLQTVWKWSINTWHVKAFVRKAPEKYFVLLVSTFGCVGAKGPR